MMHCLEQLVVEVAACLKVNPEKLKEANLYQNGLTTPFGETLTSCHIDEVWHRLKTSADFEKRSAEADTFNKVSVCKRKVSWVEEDW